MVTLKQLVYFLVLAKVVSYRGAAKACGVTLFLQCADQAVELQGAQLR